MASIFAFKCSECGTIHEGSPSYGFRAPAPYMEQSEEIKKAGHLGSDLCRYEDDDGPHFFIRVCLEIPIHGVDEPFLWGVWVSLSEQNYNRYVETYDNPVATDSYFGWLCNYLPFYENTYALKTRVRPRSGGVRPFIELEESHHPLCKDFHNGLTIQRAQEIFEDILHR